ncbi:hypothetical protein KUTeg_001067 [Tegillarca granosa]|uniref:Protein AAR2 homolog n=1 Tax=Tegillarca granosa TaxID=220873 RepID=A0ABQ9FYQ7_TEGGR|nr:hypothetical protein KUTeg_001067 [Tegillarca granosa]
MLENRELNIEGHVDYLKFTQCVFRFFSSFLKGSVLSYDKKYRDLQAAEEGTTAKQTTSNAEGHFYWEAKKFVDVLMLTIERAQMLFREGATLIFLDVPQGTEFGIDYNSWTVCSEFKGVKMIPPGIHFIYYSYKKWVSLSNHITPGVMNRLQPVTGKICSVTEFISESSNTKSRKAAAANSDGKTYKSGTFSGEEPSSDQDAESKIPDMKTKPGTEIRFSLFPKRYKENATPAEITHGGMDSSFQLDSMLSTYFTNVKTELLGEIQFSFICFLIGQVYDAFDQWKKLVHLMCSCVDALKRHTDLYCDFITVLHFQVYEIPEDFFVDIVSGNNFLTTTLQEFFANLENEIDVDKKLQKKGLKFRDHLTQKFKWDFTSESDEYAPVVVNLD